MSSRPLLSVVIPVYNTEQILPKCIQSVISQTYSNLEIIIVDDCSPGNAREIVQEFMQQDPRIKYVRLDENKGSYHARIIGSELATGDFIAFVDSDDYISIDYYRLLVEKALQEDADIVEGRFVREDESGYQFIHNFDNLLFDVLTGEEIRKAYFSQEGIFYHWHLIWNKVYKMDLWRQCVPYFKQQTRHLVMSDDLIYSTILFCNAEKYCSIPYGIYYYCVRNESTTSEAAKIKNFIKRIYDMGAAFDFLDSYLSSSGLKKLYGRHLFNWKKRYLRIWTNRIQTENLSGGEKQRLLDEIRKAFQIEQIEAIMPEDMYFAEIQTDWDNRYENLKNMIADEKYEYISFDIFDTLIVRPFLKPTDLFHFLDEYFHELYQGKSWVSFSSLRTKAEDRARRLARLQNPFIQDINLDEIYEQLRKDYGLDEELLNKLKSREIELEIEFAQRRESIYELYKMALHLNKKVVFVSDMYLPASVIKNILSKCGYDTYNALYVSSETRLLKGTGDMFSHVIHDLNVDPGKILHIGDNWDADKIMAEKSGLHSVFIPKTVDLLFNRVGDKYSGDSIKRIIDYENTTWSESEFLEYYGIRCMLGIVANKWFDNPFPAFHRETDFNADPYMIGYYALGMHVFALCKWLIEDASSQGIDSIHFNARDGYLPLKVYQKIAPNFTNAPKAKYIHISRKSLLPSYLLPPNQYDLESLVNLHAHTPMYLLKLLDGLLYDGWDSEKLKSKGIIPIKPFSEASEFLQFIDVLVKEAIDPQKLDKSVQIIKKYFSERLKQNDALFDLGYSGRFQSVISNLMGFTNNLYFVHTSKESPWNLSRRYGFQLKCFYDFKPGVSFILREHIFSEIGPSCVSYKDGEEATYPVFEEYEPNAINDFMVGLIHRGCVDFSKDMSKNFGRYFKVFKLRNRDVSLPLEMFLNQAKPIDRLIFRHSYYEDDIFGAINKGSLLKWWDDLTRYRESRMIQQQKIYESAPRLNFIIDNHGKIKKLLFYFLFDRDTLKLKVKNKFRNKPLLLNALTVTYRILRYVKRSVINKGR